MVRRRALSLVASAAALPLLAVLMGLGWANWPAADDFCNGMLVMDRGIGGALHWLYTQWSGRLVTGVLLYAAVAMLDAPSLRIVSMLAAGGMALVAWQIATFVLGRGASLRAPIGVFVLAALAFGLYPLLGQTVYWPTGAIVYWVPLVLLLHWLNGVRDVVMTGTERRGAAWGFAASVLVGNTIEMAVAVALVYLAAMAWRARGTPAMLRALLIRGFGVLIGAAVLVTAPGNFLRARATPGSFDLSAHGLGRSYAGLLEQAVDSGVAMLGVVAVILVAGLVLQRPSAEVRATGRHPGRAVRRGEAAALVLGGLASLVPVLAAPAQAAPRNALYLLVAVLVASLLVALPRPAARWPMATAIVLVTLAWIGSVAAAVRLAGDVELAAARRSAQGARHAILSDPLLRGTDVAVPPITAPAPPTLHAIDITADPGAIVNWCVASYYRLGSVRVEAPPSPR